MTLRKDHCPDNSTTAEAGAQVTNVRIDLGSTTLAVVTVLVAIIGGCGVVIGLDIAERASQEREWQKQTAVLSERMQDLQRQYRMTELKLDDWTVVAHRGGLTLPGDYARGPQGNLDAESFRKLPPCDARGLSTCNPFIAIPAQPVPPVSIVPPPLCGKDPSLCVFKGKKP